MCIIKNDLPKIKFNIFIDGSAIGNVSAILLSLIQLNAYSLWNFLIDFLQWSLPTICSMLHINNTIHMKFVGVGST